MMSELTHCPVLLEECIQGLHIRPDGVYVDGTLGRAGHSRAIAKRLTTGRLIAIDQERLAPWMERVTLVHGNFRDMPELLQGLDLSEVDGILLDLGVSSPQLDDPKRGFSYQHDAPLDMRMDQTQPLTAAVVVNTWSEGQLYANTEKNATPALSPAQLSADARRRPLRLPVSWWT